jgi:hypothetical protein
MIPWFFLTQCFLKSFGLNLNVKQTSNLFLSILFCGSIWSCEPPDATPTALLNVLLIDAPARWDSVFVEVEGVAITMQLLGRESETKTFFLPYDLGNKNIEVSSLIAGKGLLLGRDELPVGKIVSIAFRIGTSHSLFLKGDRYPLPLAKAGMNEIPIDFAMNLEQGIAYDLILDMDLEKSIRVLNETPLSMVLNPVLTAVSGIGTGELKGTISPVKLQPALYAIQSGDSVSTHINSSGNFSFRLPAGIYSIYIDPKDSKYQSATVQSVEVLPGKTTDLTRITINPK